MKFLVSSGSLYKQLLQLHGVVSNNPVVPILENFLFQLTPGKLTVQASDLETSIVAEIPVEGKETGGIAVPARLLMDTLKNLPDQPVTFSIEADTYAVSLKSANGKYKLTGENPADFPRVPVQQGSLPIEMPSSTLARAINKTIFATSTDELRPAMTGILVQLMADRTVFVTTDGHRLLRFSRLDVVGGTPRQLILPRKACTLLKSALPTEATVVNVEFNQSNAFFSFNNLRLVCRLIDERYPDYENVIPTSNPNKLVMNRQELLNSIKRISIYSNKTTHQVRLRFEQAKVEIAAEDLDFNNEARETLNCQYNGEPLEIGFNAKFLVEMLANLDCEEISLAMSTPNRAGLLTPVTSEANEDVLNLVMPVMLNNYV